MRLFVSIDIPGSIQNKLAEIVPKAPCLRKTKKEQLHITLLFLGECSDVETESIINKLRGISFSPFELIVHKTGAFPNQNEPRVIWAGVKKQPKLNLLQKTILNELSECKEQEGNHNFTPHITLARVGKRFNQHLSSQIFREFEPMSFLVDSFSLKKSELHPEGSQHKIIQTFESTKT